MQNTLKFKQWNCGIVYKRYPNKRIAICLIDAVDGFPVATATSNLEPTPCPEMHAHMKTYGGNEGLLEVLIEAGIVEDTGMVAHSGFCEFPLVKIIDPDAEHIDG